MEFRRVPPGRRILAGLSALLATLACAGSDPGKEIQTLQSWRATIDLAGEAQLRGWVTPRYVAQLRAEAENEARAAGEALSRNDVPGAQRDSITTARRDLERSLARLAEVGP